MAPENVTVNAILDIYLPLEFLSILELKLKKKNFNLEEEIGLTFPFNFL